MASKLIAEFIGTLWLVLGGCGSAVLAAAFPGVGIGLLGVSLGLWAGGRFPGKGLAPYIVAQVAGGVAGAAILFVIASGQAGFDASAGFAANGYGDHSPGKYSLAANPALASKPAWPLAMTNRIAAPATPPATCATM